MYGSNRCVKSRRVRLLSTDENFSEVLRIGDVCSIGGGLCSALISVCTIYEMILTEIKSNSLEECDCLAICIIWFVLSSSGEETRCFYNCEKFHNLSRNVARQQKMIEVYEMFLRYNKWA